MQDLVDISPQSTRIERKLLLRYIQDIEAAAQVTLDSLSTEHEELRRQLNVWFPGKFRAASGTPLYTHDDTTVVRATHKVFLLS